MPAFPVTVKWGRETYKGVECNTDEGPGVFKAQLFTLTGVNPGRQKIMVKGKTLGDDDWSTFPVTANATLLLMGSKEEDIVVPPTEQIKFVEDMNESEICQALDLPVGLSNLGNTCYLNATVQCLKTVPPLTEMLKKFPGNSVSTDAATAITASLRDLYNTMDKKIAIPPILLVQAVHSAFPRFAERTEHGFQQQDANECWTEIVRMLQQKLPADEGGAKHPSVVDEYFGGRLAVGWKCNEAPDEPPTSSEETFLQLSCFIETETRYMHAGLKNKLEEVVTKNSPSLNRDAQYTKSAKIDRLPAYLTVQLVRFFFKERGGVNAKVLKDVKFPLSFDAFDLCTKGLQDKLLPMRSKFKEITDVETEKMVTKAEAAAAKEKDMKEKKVRVPYSFADDKGSNNSGMYELQAVLTHKGRSSNSGHYLAWIKQKENLWLKCDDDDVSACTDEEILKLSGGGDWHIAYVLLYGPKVLELPEVEAEAIIAQTQNLSSTTTEENMSTE